MLRVRTVWTGVPGSPWYSNIYFDAEVADAQAAADAVIAFAEGLAAYQGSQVDWTVEDTVTVMDPVTGQPTGAVAVTGDSGSGTNTGDLLPPQTQALARINTGDFVAGRQVLGHIFLPGFVESTNVGDGVLDTATATALGELVLGISTTPGNPTAVVWARKSGTMHPYSTVTVPTKWSFLRSRRD